MRVQPQKRNFDESRTRLARSSAECCNPKGLQNGAKSFELSNISRQQNFGAIRVKGVLAGSHNAKTIEKFALEQNKTADFGENAFGVIHRYIQTMAGSEKEIELMTRLQKTFNGIKGVKIELFDDTKADKNVRRFSESKPLIVDIFG